ncbi:unnamed protein product [Colias eurytheme]|nr:unnamed protein product [Colias eurytheme]
MSIAIIARRIFTSSIKTIKTVSMERQRHVSRLTFVRRVERQRLISRSICGGRAARQRRVSVSSRWSSCGATMPHHPSPMLLSCGAAPSHQRLVHVVVRRDNVATPSRPCDYRAVWQRHLSLSPMLCPCDYSTSDPTTRPTIKMLPR